VAAWVQVGYGESAKHWHKLLASAKKSQGGTIAASVGCKVQYSPLHLGSGSQAFAQTMTLSSCGYTRAPGLQDAVYIVTALSRRHDIVQVAFTNVTLAAASAEIQKLLSDSRL
jgi:hypothetical protein